MGYGYVKLKRPLGNGEAQPGTINNPIVIGDEWQQEFIITDKEQDLILATLATPVVVTTRYPHGVANNEYVKIRNTPESPGLAGFWKAVNVTATTLELYGSAGVALAKSGSIARANDGTNCQLFGKIKTGAGVLVDDLNFSWTNQSRFHFTANFTDAETTALAAYAGETVYFAVRVKDSAGKDTTILRGEIDIVGTANS